MLRNVVIRNKLIRETFRKAVRFNTARALSVECTRRRHRHSEPALLKTTHKAQWKYETLRFYANLPPHQRVVLPALSPTMETGSIVSWEKKEGDKLSEGDLLAEIETDKATMGFETPEEGYLAKIVIPAGTKNVPIGKLVCIIVQDQKDVASFKDFKDDGAAAPAAAPAPPAPGAPAPAASAPASAAAPSPAAPQVPAESGGRVYASPMAKRLAEQRQIRLSGKGSGMFDAITSVDVPAPGTPAPFSATLRAGSPSPGGKKAAPTAAPGSFIDIPVTSMRATIAKRLVQSKQQIPHYYLTVSAKVDKLIRLRNRYNELLAKENVKISVNDFIIKAMAVACKKIPEANSIWMDTFIRQYANVDISIAVSTDKGLITPIIFNADSKGIIAISKEVKALAAKARANKLQPHEFVGGTVSISNLGMYGINSFCAVINPPQAIILAIGTTEKKLIIDPNDEKGFIESDVMSITASCDHRVIDGAVAAKWISAVREYLEHPVRMIL